MVLRYLALSQEQPLLLAILNKVSVGSQVGGRCPIGILGLGGVKKYESTINVVENRFSLLRFQEHTGNKVGELSAAKTNSMVTVITTTPLTMHNDICWRIDWD